MYRVYYREPDVDQPESRGNPRGCFEGIVVGNDIVFGWSLTHPNDSFARETARFISGERMASEHFRVPVSNPMHVASVIDSHNTLNKANRITEGRFGEFIGQCLSKMKERQDRISLNESSSS